jgi:hypothetical protein
MTRRLRPAGFMLSTSDRPIRLRELAVVAHLLLLVKYVPAGSISPREAADMRLVMFPPRHNISLFIPHAALYCTVPLFNKVRL